MRCLIYMTFISSLVTSLALEQVFIFGLGYTGLGVANVLMKRFPNCVVSGTCRSEEKKENLRNLGIDAHCFDIDSERPALDKVGRSALLSSSHVLSCIAPVGDMNTDPVLAFHSSELQKIKPWLGYLSTTGVYGDHNGAWVTETSECLAPKTSRAYPRLAAEREWLELLAEDMGQNKAFVFRLSGIYGPGRSALSTIMKNRQFQYREEKEKGEQDEKVALVRKIEMASTPSYVNRVHVGDISDAIVQAMLRGAKGGECDDSNVNYGGIYNLSDDEPAPRSEVMSFARKLLPLCAPNNQRMSRSELSNIKDGDNGRGNDLRRQTDGTFKPTLGTRAIRRVQENKRVCNARMKKALLQNTVSGTGALRYPTYREGLAAEAAGEIYPF